MTQSTVKNVLVFCGSSSGKDPSYIEAATQLGDLLGQNGYDLVYGGGNLGMMGAISAGVMQHKGRKAQGILIEAFRSLESADLPAGMEEVYVENLQVRKTEMIHRGDAAVVLPGGIGTFDEAWGFAGFQDTLFYEKNHNIAIRPVIVLNTSGYFDGTKMQFNRAVNDGLIRENRTKFIHFIGEPNEAILLLNRYRDNGRPTVADILTDPSPL